MAQAIDTSAIQRVIGRARARIRIQRAADGAVTASILASAAALAAIFAVRAELIASATGVALLCGAGVLVIVGAIAGVLRRIDDEVIARRIDRASALSDRLSTAIAFARGDMSTGDEPVTAELVEAAIRDGIRAVPRANVKAATPFTIPVDLRPAAGFLAVSALAAGLMLPTVDRSPRLSGVTPDHAPPGAVVVLHGANLLAGLPAPMAMLSGTRAVIGAPITIAADPAPTHLSGYVPPGVEVRMGAREHDRPVTVLDWTGDTITIQIPPDAPFGDTLLSARIADRYVGPVEFTVVDPKDSRYHADKSVEIDPDQKAYIESILAELHDVAQRDKVPELDEFANKLEQLLKDAEQGKITKEQLLDELAKAEDALAKNAEPNVGEIQKKMAELGKELAKDPMTKDLGVALEKNDLENAKQELEKLAEKLDKNELTDQQKQELAQKLEEVSKQMEKQSAEDKKQQDQQRQKMEEELRRLEKQKQDAKTPEERQEAERRLEEKKRELEKLDKDQQEKQQSEERRSLERLQKDMKDAAESLQQKKQPGEQDKDEDKKERDRQASQSLKDAARETGKVDQDQRKQSTTRKMSSQMDDLREAMRRAKQKGNKGPQDPFNKDGKNRDFAQRSKGGGRGNGEAWKPGQGQGQGQPQGKQNGGNGSGAQESDTWGTGHDDNLTAGETAKSGNTKDTDVQGEVGSHGSSRRETILSAAQKGFASAGYQKVYADYQRIVEEVMRTEKLPSSYKYYVKRYFAKIHPSTAPTPETTP